VSTKPTDFCPKILPSLVTHHKRGQVATSGSPDSTSLCWGPLVVCLFSFLNVALDSSINHRLQLRTWQDLGCD
jgi:hypothetical protein